MTLFFLLLIRPLIYFFVKKERNQVAFTCSVASVAITVYKKALILHKYGWDDDILSQGRQLFLFYMERCTRRYNDGLFSYVLIMWNAVSGFDCCWYRWSRQPTHARLYSSFFFFRLPGLWWYTGVNKNETKTKSLTTSKYFNQLPPIYLFKSLLI